MAVAVLAVGTLAAAVTAAVPAQAAPTQAATPTQAAPAPAAAAAPATSTSNPLSQPTLPPTTSPAQPSPETSCPWLRSLDSHRVEPAALARQLVDMMTTDEKLGELVLTSDDGYENANAGVARLCIPALTLQDGPQGLAFGDTNVTQLPAPLGIAASFDPTLAREYGKVEGAEAYGQGVDIVQGPNLNIDRVPQNGRSYETFGEDPLLITDMGVADIEGIQSQHVLAQAKHFVAYSQETNRGIINEAVPARALQELYLPPFKAAVQKAHVASVMCAYPRLNGTFQCEDPALDQLLRSWASPASSAATWAPCTTAPPPSTPVPTSSSRRTWTSWPTTCRPDRCR